METRGVSCNRGENLEWKKWWKSISRKIRIFVSWKLLKITRAEPNRDFLNQLIQNNSCLPNMQSLRMFSSFSEPDSWWSRNGKLWRFGMCIIFFNFLILLIYSWMIYHYFIILHANTDQGPPFFFSIDVYVWRPATQLLWYIIQYILKSRNNSPTIRTLK